MVVAIANLYGWEYGGDAPTVPVDYFTKGEDDRISKFWIQDYAYVISSFIECFIQIEEREAGFLGLPNPEGRIRKLEACDRRLAIGQIYISGSDEILDLCDELAMHWGWQSAKGQMPHIAKCGWAEMERVHEPPWDPEQYE